VADGELSGSIASFDRRATDNTGDNPTDSPTGNNDEGKHERKPCGGFIGGDRDTRQPMRRGVLQRRRFLRFNCNHGPELHKMG
jgi:hypothetical protein